MTIITNMIRVDLDVQTGLNGACLVVSSCFVLRHFNCETFRIDFAFGNFRLLLSKEERDCWKRFAQFW